MDTMMKEETAQVPSLAQAPETKGKWKPHLPKSRKGKRWLKIASAADSVSSFEQEM